MIKSKALAVLVLSALSALIATSTNASAAAAPDTPIRTQSGQDFNQVVGKLFDAKLVDKTLVKASSLEVILNQKANRILETLMIPPSEYRVNATVTVTKTEKPEVDATSGSEESDAKGEVLNVGYLIDKFENGDKAEKTPSADSADDDGNYTYEASSVQMQVTFTPKVDEEIRKTVEKLFRQEFAPVFGERLKLQLSTSPYQIPMTKPEPESFGDVMVKFQFVIVAIIFGLILLGGLVLNKLVPSRQQPTPVQVSLTNNSAEPAPVASPSSSSGSLFGSLGLGLGLSPEAAPKPASRDGAATQPAGTTGEGAEDAKLLLSQMQGIEKQLSSFTKENPGLAREILQQWVAGDEFDKVTLYLESLAKQGVGMERLELRPEIVKTIRKSRAKVSRLNLRQRHAVLEDLYWVMVSGTFFGEDANLNRFNFLESIDDNQISEMIASEPTDSQVTVLLAMNEKRSGRILNQMDAERRELILSQIFSAQPVDQGELDALVERLSLGANQLHDSRPNVVRLSDGVDSLVPILEKMDFQTQFATAQSFLTMQPELRARLESRYFQVGLMPDARSEFLASVFGDRPPEWINAVLSRFSEEFRARVVEVLPPLLQQMIQDSSQASVVPSFAMAILRELDRDIQARLADGQITNGMIFPEEGETIEPSPQAEFAPEQADPEAAEPEFADTEFAEPELAQDEEPQVGEGASDENEAA